MSYESDLDVIRQVLAKEPKQEPLAQTINTLLFFAEHMLEDINNSFPFASKEEILASLDISEDDLYALDRIATKLQLIASSILERNVKRLRAVQ